VFFEAFCLALIVLAAGYKHKECQTLRLVTLRAPGRQNLEFP
jgi:hypothetical protein